MFNTDSKLPLPLRERAGERAGGVRWLELVLNFVYNVPLARQQLRDLTRSKRKSGRP